MLYTFENYSLDADRQELRRGTDRVAIEPRVFDLLHFLIRNRERLISKDDLIANVWNGRTVSDSALSSRITIARQAIGDSGEEQRLIRTVARRGIRFVGEVFESSDGSPSSARPGSVDAKESAAAQTKILLVDDHALIREALRGVLKALKGDALILDVPDARRAMQSVAENPDIELIVLDLNLPDRKGLEVLAELRDRYPSVSVVVLSASDARDHVVKALDLGALGFIPKSASREVMLSAFNLIFAGGIYVPPEILATHTKKSRR